jgi:hypothetical protein
MKSGIDYECRTTLNPDRLPEADVQAEAGISWTGELIRGFHCRRIERDTLNFCAIRSQNG